MAQTEKCPYCFTDLMAAGLRDNAWNRRLHVEKSSKTAQKRKITKHVTLETFFKKKKSQHQLIKTKLMYAIIPISN